MKLSTLTIQTDSYGFNGRKAGDYHGTITFVNDTGSLSINLDKQLAEKVLEVVGDVLVETAKMQQETLLKACIEGNEGAKLKSLENLERKEIGDDF